MDKNYVKNAIEACKAGDKSLDLNGNMLTKLPDEIFELTHLTELNISNNKIGAIPAAIKRLTKLKDLGVVDCGLKELPPEMGDLKALRDLNISDNEISVLPEQLGKLTKLTTLILHCNPIEVLPDWIGDLTSLKTLWVSYTKVSELPKSLAKLTALTELSLAGSKFEHFPEVILSLTSLKELSLEDNAIGSVPSAITRLKSLKKLELGSTGLTELPVELASMRALKELDVGGNNLTKIAPEFANSKLGDINLYGNPITNLEAKLAADGDWDAIQAALFEQLGAKAKAAPSGAARYATFIASKEFEKFSGRTTRGWGKRIEFDEPAKLRERIEGDNAHFGDADSLDNYPHYVPLAVPQFSEDEEEDLNPSDYDEFLVVDTSTDEHSVFLWDHEGGFGRIAKNFAYFLEELEPA